MSIYLQVEEKFSRKLKLYEKHILTKYLSFVSKEKIYINIIFLFSLSLYLIHHLIPDESYTNIIFILSHSLNTK